jgi:hypothetical protein
VCVGWKFACDTYHAAVQSNTDILIALLDCPLVAYLLASFCVERVVTFAWVQALSLCPRAPTYASCTHTKTASGGVYGGLLCSLPKNGILNRDFRAVSLHKHTVQKQHLCNVAAAYEAHCTPVEHGGQPRPWRDAIRYNCANGGHGELQERWAGIESWAVLVAALETL